jgi:hypothetical protein
MRTANKLCRCQYSPATFKVYPLLGPSNGAGGRRVWEDANARSRPKAATRLGPAQRPHRPIM